MNQYPYDNQQPYYQFHQQTAGPPQPSWQAAARKGWGDPRLSQDLSSPVSAQSSALPLQSFPPPPPGPPPKAQPGRPWTPPVHDTSVWGVKHNQQFHQPQDGSARPPLPARPSSIQAGYQSWTTAQAQQETPPVPPPRPPQYAVLQPLQQQTAYLEQTPFYPHEQYTQQAPSHQYEPAQNSWTSQSQFQPYSVDSIQAWQPPASQAQGYNAISPIEPSQYTWQNHSAPMSTSLGYHQLPHGPDSQLTQSQPYQQEPTPFVAAPVYGAAAPSDGQRFAGEHSHPTERVAVPQKHTSLTATPEQIPVVPTSAHQLGSGPQTSFPPSNTLSSAVALPQNSRLHLDQTTQYPGPPKLEMNREDSDLSDTTSQIGPQRTSTIDMVMKAWSSPIDTSVRPLQSSQLATTTLPPQTPTLRATKPAETQTDFPPIIKTETRIETKEVDPYGDLKDEYRTSLSRYVTMLRQERDAANNEQKSKVVFDFVNREVKLRSVLFNVEPAELVASAELAELRKSSDAVKQMQAELAELKGSAEHARGLEVELSGLRNDLEQARQARPAHEPSLSAQISKSDKPEQQIHVPDEVGIATKPIVSTTDGNLDSHKNVSSIVTDVAQVDTNGPGMASKNLSSTKVDEDDEDDQYSPGGRPRYIQPAKQQRKVSTSSSERPTQMADLTGAVARPASPSDNAPMLLEDYTLLERSNLPARTISSSPKHDSPSLSPAHALTPKSAGPLHFQPSRPAYMPFRYSEAASNSGPKLDGSQRADEAYIKLRQEQAVDSGRLLNLDSPQVPVTAAPDRAHTTTPSRAKQQHEEAFLGLLRQQSLLQRRPGTAPAMSDSSISIPRRAGTPFDKGATTSPIVKVVQNLRAIIPSNLSQLAPTPAVHPKLMPIASELDKIVDDFGFIKATVVAWDKENRVSRHRLETERSERESENQDHVDELFRENQIGYADIAGLEEEFKLAEATRKYQEDQQELESFTKSVFEVVASRLESEVSALESLRSTTLEVLDSRTMSASGRLRTAISTPVIALEKALLSETMALVLDIHNKIEVRQTKLAEAYFERERRRKRIELNILYVNGDTTGVKQLEKEFDKAQSLQVLADARQRDERANTLMDSIDRATVRGLAENQDWIDAVSNKITLLRDLVHGAHGDSLAVHSRDELLYGPSGIKETMDLLAQAVHLVLTDSRELVKISSQADRLLNEADFAMFVAEARIVEADQVEFDKLTAEKAKEDLRLETDFNGKISGATCVPDEILASVKEIKDFIGNDSEHSVRISSALEAAKQRNGARPSIPT